MAAQCLSVLGPCATLCAYCIAAEERYQQTARDQHLRNASRHPDVQRLIQASRAILQNGTVDRADRDALRQALAAFDSLATAP